MRILVGLGGSPPASRGAAAGRLAAALAGVAAAHEVVLSHGAGAGTGSDPAGEAERAGQSLALAFRNALPDRQVVSVACQVVVAAGEPVGTAPAGPRGRARPAAEPRAIVALPSLRALLGAGALLICAAGPPVALAGGGAMRPVESAVDEDLTAALLARRLDADLLLLLTDVDSAPPGSKVEAARRFVAATGRRAAIGAPERAAALVAVGSLRFSRLAGRAQRAR